MRKLIAGLIVAAIALISQTAEAQFLTSYTANLTDGQPVTNIFMLEVAPDESSMTWAFSANGSGSTELNNPFEHDTEPTSALLIGLVQNLPFDAPGQTHVVLFMANNAAALSNHIAWGTLFRHTDEDQLIAAIQLGSSGQDFPIIQPGLDAINAFAGIGGDAQTGILDPQGQPVSAWFNEGDSFTVVSWSDGQTLGTGTSSITVIPEPASISLLLLGASPLLLRRRRSNRHPRRRGGSGLERTASPASS